MDIVVTMPRNEIDHWDEKVSYSLIAENKVWWNMKRLPKNFTTEDYVFVVMDGKVRGFFEIRDIEYKENANKVFLQNFMQIKEINMKGFQGFRYRKFEFQEA